MTDLPSEQKVILMPQFCFMVVSKKQVDDEIVVKVVQVPNQDMLNIRKVE